MEQLKWELEQCESAQEMLEILDVQRPYFRAYKRWEILVDVPGENPYVICLDSSPTYPCTRQRIRDIWNTFELLESWGYDFREMEYRYVYWEYGPEPLIESILNSKSKVTSPEEMVAQFFALYE